MNTQRKIFGTDILRRIDESVRTGPSYQEIIAGDKIMPPADLLEHHAYPVPPAPVSRDRYTSMDVHRREFERLWSRVWQLACREDEVAEPGDIVVYELCDISILIVRGKDMQLRAFRNTCLHRGTKLCAADTHLSELRCPYHGFTWALNGELADVPSRWDFPFLKDENFRLHEVKVDIWARNVFVNLDPDPQPLLEYLEVLPEHFQGVSDYANKFVVSHYRKRLQCNWKAGIEAFIENFHSLETHPQTVRFNADDNTQYDVFPGSRHTSRFLIANGAQSPHLAGVLTEQEIFAALFAFMAPGGEVPAIPEGMTARTWLAELARQAAAQASGNDYSACSDVEILDPLQYLLFPNIIIFRGLAVPLIYRFRPDGHNPDACIFEMLVMRDLPPDGTRPDLPEIEDFGDHSFTEAALSLPPWLREIYDQDTQNLALQQLGFKVGGPTEIWFSREHESRNRHFHHTLDAYLAD